MKGLIDFTGAITGQQDLVYQYGPALEGNIEAVEIPDDFSYAKYDYTPAIAGVYDPNGFVLKPVDVETIDFAKRQMNVQMMNGYMANLVTSNQLTQSNFDLFLSDTAALVQQYLGGGGRLITWIETVSRNGFNATTTGFKTKTTYRGALNNGVYPRAEAILAILNDL